MLGTVRAGETFLHAFRRTLKLINSQSYSYIGCRQLQLTTLQIMAAENASGTEEVRELMFSYEAHCTFVEKKEQPCRFRTSLCPDQCG
jgi:hypothetical protein